MKAVRIVLEQNTANYKKEECIDNAMTYPLPPISTVIGALHSACGYNDYHDMKISIQGKFGSMQRVFKLEKIQHNTCQDDRGILVKKASTSISNAYTVIAKSLKRNCSFRKNKDIIILDENKYNEYIANLQELEVVKKELKEKKEKYNAMKKEERKESGKGLKESIEKTKEKQTEIKNKLNLFETIENQMHYKEVLNQVKLVIHVAATNEVLEDICNNIQNLTAIGRSGDFINVCECKAVELSQDKKCIGILSDMSAYLGAMDLDCFTDFRNNEFTCGTRYVINKNYKIVDNKRMYKKVSVLYRSNYKLKEYSENVFVDENSEHDIYIVNFL